MDRDHGGAGVVVTAEERVLLEAVELAAQGDGVLLDLVELSVVGDQRHELAEVLGLAAELVVALEAAREPRVLRGDAGGPSLVVPEPRGAHGLFELGESRLQTLGVKGNHGPRPTGSQSLRASRSTALLSAMRGW